MGYKVEIINGIPHTVSDAVTTYDQTYVAVGTVTSGTAVTLPSSGTYDSVELEVYLDGTLLERTSDYNYVGVVPRTQVTFTFDLELDDHIRFIKRS